MRKYSKLISNMVVSLHNGTCEYENLEILTLNLLSIFKRLKIISTAKHDEILNDINTELDSCEETYYDTFIALPESDTAR